MKKITKEEIREEMNLIKSVGRLCNSNNLDIWHGGLSTAWEKGNWYNWSKKEIIDEAYKELNI